MKRFIETVSPCFVIAEAGVNHNGDLSIARKLIDAAAAAGANAIKFQTFHTNRLVTRAAPKAQYQLASGGAHESQFDMLRRLELGPQAHIELQAHAQRRNILFLSTPFDEPSADLLYELDIPVFKIGSGEVTNTPFLRYVAGKRKPMILSTGMADLDEVGEAVKVVRASGCEDLTLLHCTSNYPTQPDDCNLRALVTMRQAFNVPVGYSDHTEGSEVAVAAVALGAVVIEKHITLDRNLDGPDQRASSDPADFKQLVDSIRKIERALGTGDKRPAQSESQVRDVARRSIVAARDLPEGTTIERVHLDVKRPGTGIQPKDLDRLIGKKLVRSIRGDELLQWADFQ